MSLAHSMQTSCSWLCLICRISRPCRDAQDRLLRGDCTQLITGKRLDYWYYYGFAGPSLFPGVIEAVSMSGASASAALLGLKLAVDVMVVACPCALGLATPTAVLVASSMGAQRGLLLRGGDVLERMAHINVVAFDKTGTLTQVSSSE